MKSPGYYPYQLSCQSLKASVVLALLHLLPGTASACMVCTSNLIYNGAPFLAIWMLGFLGWAWFIYDVKRRSPESENLVALWSWTRSFLIVMVVVYFILGMHLGLVAFFPVLLLLPEAWRRDAALAPVRKVSRILLLALVVVAFAGQKYLPRCVGEVTSRVMTARATTDLQNLLRKTDTMEAKDPFAYTVFPMSSLAWLSMSNEFYYPDDREKSFRTVTSPNGTVVWSRGPNGLFDISTERVKAMLDKGESADVLINHTYDATNGMTATSPGDIVKHKLTY